MNQPSNIQVNDSNMADITAIDRGLFAAGIRTLGGVDEAGRGPLAGPVCAAAVVFAANVFVEGVHDSKRLSARQREALYHRITASALSWSVGWADPSEIDELNILRATKLAMLRALEGLSVRPELTLIDCIQLSEWKHPQQSLIKGDARSHAIAAASIIAKVERDRLMAYYDQEYPGYGFAHHKGYPTPQHAAALSRLGLTTIHRRSFVGEDLFRVGLRKSNSFREIAELMRTNAVKWSSPGIQERIRKLPMCEVLELSLLAISRGD
ncbi:MAG: ribonuclease HII [Candidatus Sumerlaeaceae bacterium]|nr:ribonuclease HII [Candidatus Sumerlaeaceae bacterium]